uniref:hydrocephalus-inducing protein homolog n=1 Tax=Agelaius phoeniceus TaxID=39638 RepID=UPI0023ED0B9C|nr:hydrocephalus-inducing protein homolog [Agelaius phoeniceus]
MSHPVTEKLMGQSLVAGLLSAAPKQSWFGVSPPVLVFQNFIAGEVSEMVLSLMNKDKMPRLVKVCMESCPYFQLACPRDVYHMVPAGASAPVRIRFSPDENKDYCHELVCITARERTVVPIRAIGARAVLDFPAQLDFSKCPVKVSTRQTLLVRNVGARAARYQLSTQSPFSVVPATGALGAGDTVQVTVAFHPLASGAHCGSLAVCCSSGEERIHTKLHGEAVDVNIGLSTDSVEVDKTFITMSSHRTLFIENRSNITAHFQWKAFPSEEEENEEKRSMVQEKMAKVREDPMLFSHDIFVIEPMEGEIGPNCSAEIKVTFKPLEALEYGSVAYCSISGRESRLPLQLRGEGQGPLVELSSQTLNLGNVFVNTPHVCEVKLMNQGALDAPFTRIPSGSNVGLCFKFAPEEGIIAAGGSQSVQISFSATVLGSFEEEFQFSVAGSPRPAILTIKGSVTAPSVHFDLPELDFGDISFGFPYTRRCRLTNSSPVPLTFQLRMSDDGTQPAVDSVDQIRRDTDPVTLCSNTVMEFYRRMLVDLEGIGKGVATLILTARCLVPELQVSPQVLLYDECHLKVPYERKLIIRNPSHLPGCYGLIPQPQSTAEIPVVVEVQALGTHRTNVVIGVFGDERNPLAFSILPVSGVLQPGESQQVSSTFSGHLRSTCNVPELCHVEGGPSYEGLVPGEVSRVSSSLSPREINCGSQAPLRERRELKQSGKKLQEEAKALEAEERQKDEERQKQEKKGVSNEMHAFCYEYEETS